MFKVKYLFMFLLAASFLICPSDAKYMNITVTEDSYISNINKDYNYGDSKYLESVFSASNQEYIYIKFYIPCYASSAKINIYCSGNPGGTINIYQTSYDWNENDLTWNNQPSFEYTSSAINSSIISTNNTWYTFDVSSVVKEPGYYSFKLRGGGTTNIFNSSEALTNQPYIEVEPIIIQDFINNNKTDDDDRAFLVETGNCIRFSINPPDSENISSYSWSVNKSFQYSTSSHFDFVVPAYDSKQPSTGIWEIRTVATYINGTSICREWLISSLLEEEAPEFIDYFIDQNSKRRTGYYTDPWGRLPPFYAKDTNLISTGTLSGTDSSTGIFLRSKFNVTYGTFKYKIRNPGYFSIAWFKVIGTSEPTFKDPSVLAPPYWKYELTGNEFHDYFCIISNRIGFSGSDNRFTWGAYIPISRRWIGQAPSVHYWNTPEWKEITIIHTPDGWWSVWENGTLIPQNFRHFDEAFNNATLLELGANGLLEMDCIEVYENKYLYPNANIRYGSYPKWWVIGDLSTGCFDPVNEEGIIASGRNLTLKQISDSINDEDLVTYNAYTKTAIIKTNLFLEAGSELNIKDEALLFDTSTDSLDFSSLNGATLRIRNSTVSTIGNNPLRWNLQSSVSLNVFDPINSRNLTVGRSTPRTQPCPDYGRFIVENSVINNTCNLFLDGPTEVTIKNVVFSNHSESNYGDYTLFGNVAGFNNWKKQATGEKALWIVPRNDLTSFEVNNITFVNPKMNLDLKIVGGEWIFNSTTIENSDLSNVDISTKKAYKYEYYQDYRDDNESSHVSLLNCKFNDSRLKSQTDHSKIETKYYADIFVKDSGNLSQKAVVTLTASDTDYEAENLYKYDEYIVDAYGPGAGGVTGYGTDSVQYTEYSGGTYVRWYNALPLNSTTTNSKGRTSLPSEDINNSIVLTDYVLTNETGKLSKESIEYDLSIKCSDSKSVYLQDIDPNSDWYRPDPNIPTYTITAIIPDDSKGPHITGFAPSTENPFNPGEKKNFRVWTDEPLTGMEWRVNGSCVLKGALNYTWNVTGGNTKIEFVGSNTNGTVNQVWSLGGSSSELPVPDNEPAQEIKFSPAESIINKNVSEVMNFSASPDVFTKKEWYVNGDLVLNNSASLCRSWSAAGSYTVTFSGSANGVPVLHTWTVNIVEKPKDEVQNKSIITIAPGYQVIEPNKPFNLGIRVEPGTPITGAQLDFLFNSSMVSANNVTEGDLFKQNGASTIFSGGTIDNSAGSVKHIYGLILGTSNVSSPGTMATISLTAGNRTGIAKLNLSDVTISDANSKSVPYTVTNATVLVDTAPVMNHICCPKSVDEKSTLAFKVSAKDADGDRLILSASGLPQGAVFNTTSGAFSWTPERGQAGVYTFTFKVTDGYLTDSQNVTVTVNKLNNPPVISYFEPLNGSSFSEGERIDISVNASDADGQKLNYSIRVDGVEYSTGTSYIWETDYSSSGNHTIEVIVSDGIDEIKVQNTIFITDCHPRYDVNEDGVVNILDITRVSQMYGTTVNKPYPRQDVNQDGIINIQDLTLVGYHFGEIVK